MRREAILFERFEIKLNASWSTLGRDYHYDPDGPGGLPPHTAAAQRELLDSLEDLLRRQERLYSGFQKLEASLDKKVSHEDRVQFLSSFEDLLRRESKLLFNFEYLIKLNFNSTGTDSFDDDWTKFDYDPMNSDSIPVCLWCSG